MEGARVRLRWFRQSTLLAIALTSILLLLFSPGDLQGFLGRSKEVPVGYKDIRVFFKINADISEDEKENLVKMAQKYSPVFNTITKSAPVSVQLET